MKLNKIKENNNICFCGNIMKVYLDKKGFTLVEIMIAMALLSIMGLFLVNVLRTTITAWHDTESQSIVNETARNIIKVLQKDISSIYTNLDENNEIKMVLDFDKFGRQRLRFIKKIANTEQHSILKNAGSIPVITGGKNYYYGLNSKIKKIRATGGLAEIMYLFTPRKNSMKLLRGFKTPIGGSKSFFHNNRINNSKKIEPFCILLYSNIIFLGIKCWDSNSKTWQVKNSGATLEWEKKYFPLKIQLTFIIRGNHSPVAKISKNINKKQETIHLKEPNNFGNFKENQKRIFRIDDELVYYQKNSDNTLYKCKRGAFGTQAKNHLVNTPVYWGTYFSVTICLPNNFKKWIVLRANKK